MIAKLTLETTDSTVGALQIGLALSLFLLGASTLQLFYYFEHYSTDSRALKVFVVSIWFLEALHAVCMLHAVYTTSIIGFGSEYYIDHSPWSMELLLPFSALIDISVESYFAYRIKLLSDRWGVPIFCWSLMAVRLGTIISAIVFSVKDELHGFMTHHQVVLLVAFGSLALVDYIILMANLYWFAKIRNVISASSDKLADKLSIFALECGLLTFIFGLGALLTALILPQSYIWFAILCVHSKVYSNALLFSLNRRQSIAKKYNPGGRNLLSFLTIPPVGNRAELAHVHTGAEEKDSKDSNVPEMRDAAHTDSESEQEITMMEAPM